MFKLSMILQVVGFFITQHEDAGSIAEALHLMKEWYGCSESLCFMIDNSKAEVIAIERTFPGIIHFCNFSSVL